MDVDCLAMVSLSDFSLNVLNSFAWLEQTQLQLTIWISLKNKSLYIVYLFMPPVEPD